MMNNFFFIMKMDRKTFLMKKEKKFTIRWRNVSTHADGPNIVLETITMPRKKKLLKSPQLNKQAKPSKLKPSVKLYNNYNDFTRERYIDRV
ncbi:uncharacterized protein BX663DRAFT_569057, partial [Cokeromyces recurvatus]|uniref:uncharacterized protein n=1 Tax=Cokeromyces recurvatus TaxID=90255 RepID=UPI00221F06B0